MMAKEYKCLIDKIISNTKNRKITWEQASNEEVFKAKIGQGYVAVEKSYYINKTRCRITFSLINENGFEADSFSFTDEDNDLELYDLLKSLHDIAKDSYLKVNDTVQAMLKELYLLEKGSHTI